MSVPGYIIQSGVIWEVGRPYRPDSVISCYILQNQIPIGGTLLSRMHV